MAGVQERSPLAVYETSKSTPEVEQCLATRLSRLGVPSVIRGPTETVMVYGNPNPAFTLSLGQGSVAVRSAILRPSSGFMHDIEGCL